jgi:hypothetical protein
MTYNVAFAQPLLQLKSNNALCTVELHVTDNNMKILSVAQQWFMANMRGRQQ